MGSLVWRWAKPNREGLDGPHQHHLGTERRGLPRSYLALASAATVRHLPPAWPVGGKSGPWNTA